MTTTRHVQAESLETAARYLRVLRALEQAHMLGNEEELVSLFGGLDPVDVQECAGDVQRVADEFEMGLWVRRWLP